MAPENQIKDQPFGQSPIYEPTPKSSGFAGRLKLELFDLWSGLSDSLGSYKRLILIIIAGLLLIGLTVLLLPVFYQPELQSNITVNRQFQEIKVESVTIVPRTETSAVIVVYLRNPNKVYGIDGLKYSWQADGIEGGIISESGTTYILPEEDKFLIVPVIGHIPRNVDFSLHYNNDDFTRAVFARGANIEVVNVVGENVGNGFSVSGEVINRSPYLLRNVDLVTLLRAPTAALRGAFTTQLTNLEPNAARSFRYFWPRPLPGDTLINVRASVNILNPVNLDLPGGTPSLNGHNLR